MTDKETVVEMLKSAGFKIKSELFVDHRLILKDGDEANTIVVENESGGSVAFAFDDNGKLEGVWGRSW